MKHRIHAFAGGLAMLLISSFMISTLYTEFLASHEQVAMVKSLIVLPGLFILIPCLMAVGGSGFSLARGRSSQLVNMKKKRMPFIAMNGIFVLVPCAIFLNNWASQGRFDTVFYSLQSIEILAGTVNLSLMSLNLKDGLRLSGRLRKTPVITPQ